MSQGAFHSARCSRRCQSLQQEQVFSGSSAEGGVINQHTLHKFYTTNIVSEHENTKVRWIYLFILTDGDSDRRRSRNLGRWAGLSLFHSRDADTAHKQHAAGRLVVNDEDKGPVDGESRSRDREHAVSTSCGHLIAALIHGHSRFKINLKTNQSKVNTLSK